MNQTTDWLTEKIIRWIRWIDYYTFTALVELQTALPFCPSLSYTFICTTPLVLFRRIMWFRPSLLLAVPSCAESSSAHHSLLPVNTGPTWFRSCCSAMANNLDKILTSSATKLCKSRCDANKPLETLWHNQIPTQISPIPSANSELPLPNL